MSIQAESVSVYPERFVVMLSGDSREIVPTVLPEDTSNKTVLWSSSDESVATVSNGVVTGVAVGEAIITATTEDGGHTATSSVKVRANTDGTELGKKIAIKFTDRVMGDFELLPKLPLILGKFEPLVGFAKASTYYSSYYPSNAFDGSTSSMWYARTTGSCWIEISTVRPKRLGGFRWYVESSYRPKDFTVQGSNDGINWVDIYTGTSPDVTGWHEFYWNYADSYMYHRWSISTKYSSYLYLYAIEAFVHDEKALRVTGQQWDYVGGYVEEVDYAIKSVSLHPTEENTLVIELNDNYQEAFDEVEGELRVQYDGVLGNLIGYGGALESFDITFKPSDLVKAPNPSLTEYLTVAWSTGHDMKLIEYIDAFVPDETVVVASLTNNTTLIYSSIENP